MKIISATVENFKRIEVVEIVPEGSVVEITGQNRQGKSSILDAIEAALGGKDHDPKEPIKRGREKARVILDLGGLIVERVWTAKTDRLILRRHDGAQYPRPQERLDKLVGGLAFDPLAFMAMKAAEQRATLLRVINVDLESFETRRRTAFDRRTGTNRDLRAAKLKLEGAPALPEGTPDEEVSVADLSGELREAMEKIRANENVRAHAEQMKTDAVRGSLSVGEQEQAVKMAEQQLADAKKRLVERKDALRLLAGEVEKAEAEAKALVDPDLTVIQSQIASAEETNRQVRQKAERTKLSAEVDRLAALAQSDADEIATVNREQDEKLAATPMPVPNLSISEDGLTLNGLPLDQASTMEQIRACTAIGAALNPHLRIALIRHGNDMDAASLKAFYDECEAQGLQAWVERINGIGADAIVIEEGRVVGAEKE